MTKEEWAFSTADVDHAAYDGSASRGGRSATLPQQGFAGRGKQSASTYHSSPPCHIPRRDRRRNMEANFYGVAWISIRVMR